MVEKLDQLVEDITSLHSKLILLTGPPMSGKSQCLQKFSERRKTPTLNVGAALGRQLLTVPSTRRHLLATELLAELSRNTARNGLLLMDNIELLFDCNLRLNPIDLLKRHAHANRVIAVWPGDLRENRLSYATTVHPEHRDYAVDGFVPFEIY